MQPNNNLVELLAPYIEKQLWVAFNEDRTRVAGSGKTAIEALKEAKRNNIEKPFLLKAIPDFSKFMLA